MQKITARIIAAIIVLAGFGVALAQYIAIVWNIRQAPKRAGELAADMPAILLDPIFVAALALGLAALMALGLSEGWFARAQQWWHERTKQGARPSSAGDGHSVTSYGQTGGITAHTVHGAEDGAGNGEQRRDERPAEY